MKSSQPTSCLSFLYCESTSLKLCLCTQFLRRSLFVYDQTRKVRETGGQSLAGLFFLCIVQSTCIVQVQLTSFSEGIHSGQAEPHPFIQLHWFAGNTVSTIIWFNSEFSFYTDALMHGLWYVTIHCSFYGVFGNLNLTITSKSSLPQNRKNKQVSEQSPVTSLGHPN